jgi:magnesium transporter
MINRYIYKETVWVDIINPTESEVTTIAQEFNIQQAIARELTSPSVKSRTELHKDYIYLILHFPAFKHTHGSDSRQEVDFIIGKNFLITARYETIDAMEKFVKVVEVNNILDRGFPEDCTGILFFGIVQEIYQSLFNELEYIESWLMKIEEGIFAGEEKQMVLALSQASRNLLNFKKATDFHQEVLNSLDTYGRRLFQDDHFTYHIHRILDEYTKVRDALQNNMEFVAELRETNNSLLSTKENEIMKTLTIMAFVTFPLTLIATIFSMDTRDNPIVGMPHDFWIVLGIMLCAMIVFFGFFKYKKWF